MKFLKLLALKFVNSERPGERKRKVMLSLTKRPVSLSLANVEHPIIPGIDVGVYVVLEFPYDFGVEFVHQLAPGEWYPPH